MSTTKVLQINSCNFGSTGSIMQNIANELRKHGHECITICAPGRSMLHNLKDNLFIGDRISKNLHIALGWLTGLQGCFSIISTIKMLSRISREKVDIIQLHNLHNCYINLPILFHYIKITEIPVVWTLHDCWAFTGHCAYFDEVDCDKWKHNCYRCPQYNRYPQTMFDNSSVMYKLKQKWFSEVDKLIIVTPSTWLGKNVNQSFLSNYNSVVIHNGIDLSVFDYTKFNNGKLKRKKMKIVLGVAHEWDRRKGIDVFIKLAQILPSNYQIILVGTDYNIEKYLPKNIISIHRTRNKERLAKLYTAADVFVNPTREDNYPTVNLEALACGTPVISFNSGGSAECFDETCGIIIPTGDIRKMKNAIEFICTRHPFSAEACRMFVIHSSKKEMCENYINLYERILKCEHEGIVS